MASIRVTVVSYSAQDPTSHQLCVKDKFLQSLSIQVNSVERLELLPVFTGPFGRAITHLILIFYLADKDNLKEVRFETTLRRTLSF